VVDELGADLVGPIRDRGVGFDRELLDAEHVVGEPHPALLDVEAPTSEATALRDDHALQTSRGRDNLGRDGEGLVLDADDTVLGEAAHAGEELLRLPPDERWSPR